MPAGPQWAKPTGCTYCSDGKCHYKKKIGERCGDPFAEDNWRIRHEMKNRFRHEITNSCTCALDQQGVAGASCLCS